MPTLLQMLNDLRVLLREDRLTTISTSDERTQAHIALINRSAKDVLESRIWSFDKRTDGAATFYAALGGTELWTFASGTTHVRVDPVSGWGNFANSDRVSRFAATSSTLHPNLTYRVDNANTTDYIGNLTLYLDPAWIGDSLTHDLSATWQIYSTDILVPSTVRQILSARDEEQPVHLEFSEKEIFWDSIEPRVPDSTARPYAILYGWTGTSTYETTLGSATTGTVMSIRPVPSEDTVIYYDYVYRHSDLSSDSDTFSNVPQNVTTLIVTRAFYYALISNIESDRSRADRVLEQYRTDYALAAAKDSVTPNRRRIPRTFGSRIGIHPNYRWQSREVPSP